VPIGDDVIADAFTRLRFPFARDRADFIVTPPSYRFDLALEEDYVEEIARMYGYERLPATPAAHVQHMLRSPEAHVQHMLRSPEARRTQSDLKRRLLARDWQEIITFGFVSSTTEALLAPDAATANAPIRVLNPIATHLDVMRTTLLPGLLETLRTNLNHKAPRVRVFEVGRVFHRADAGFAQPLKVGGLAYGDALPEQWGERARRIDFFDVKGDLEAIAPERVTTTADVRPWLHPGRAAHVSIGDMPCGFLGELHPRLVRHFELPHAPVVFEVDLEPLLAADLPVGRPVSKQPIARRDIAIVVDEGVPAEDVRAALEAAKPPNVDRIEPFDVYRGAGLPPGKKSLAILVLMQDTARTLTDADMDATISALVGVLQNRFGGTLRQ
jgi:phenylalanyl-tRNA synthetase beta chain